MDLLQKKCVPCEGGMPPLTEDTINDYKKMLQTSWEIVFDSTIDTQGKPEEGAGKKLTQEFKFKDFKEAMVFVNNVADIAETEGHHPDISINYNRVILELTTHAIGGLSENDFIMARKIEILIEKTHDES